MRLLSILTQGGCDDKVLKQQGKSLKRIACKTGLACNTVKKYLQRTDTKTVYQRKAHRPSKLAILTINSEVKIYSLSINFYVDIIKIPSSCTCKIMPIPAKFFIQLWCIMLNSTVNSGMADIYAMLSQHFLQHTITYALHRINIIMSAK